MDYYKQNTYSFPQLVFKQIQIIQEICKKELRGGDKIIKNLVGEQEIENEDTRQSYLQSIDLLGSLLSPYFGSDLTTNFDKFILSYQMELKEALEDKEFKKEICENFNIKEEDKEYGVIQILRKDKNLMNEINVYFLNEKLKFARIIFRDLIKCFKDNNFLTQESYGESGSAEDSMEANDEDIEDYNEVEDS
jgi:hypothetical protein